MKRCIILLFVLVSYTSNAQFIATMEMKDSVPGICNTKAVYALFPGFDGQIPAKCAMSDADIQTALNEKCPFLKANPKFKGEGMVGILVNCHGEVVQCKIDNSTGKTELDDQILAVFNALNEWTVGTLDQKPVDCSELFSYKIKKGVLTLN